MVNLRYSYQKNRKLLRFLNNKPPQSCSFFYPIIAMNISECQIQKWSEVVRTKSLRHVWLRSSLPGSVSFLQNYGPWLFWGDKKHLRNAIFFHQYTMHSDLSVIISNCFYLFLTFQMSVINLIVKLLCPLAGNQCCVSSPTWSIPLFLILPPGRDTHSHKPGIPAVHDK